MFKKNMLIGLAGMILTILIIILIMNSNGPTEELELVSLLLGLTLVLFFVGFAIGGLPLGVPFGLYMAALCGIMAAPDQIKGPLSLLFFCALVLGLKLLGLLRKKNSFDNDIAELDEKRKSDEAKKIIFNDAISLIKPNKFKADITYKVVDKNDFFYFCRCGGQFYVIDPGIAQSTNLSEDELLAHKDSFRVQKDEIRRVSIRSKIRYWTGNVPNNGSADIVTEKENRFIIHGINDFPRVQALFKASLNCPVAVSIDPKRKQAEDAEFEFETQDDEIKKRVRAITGFLNTAGMVSGLWLIFYPRPIRLAVIVGLIIPILGLLFYLLCGQSVSFDENRNNLLPNIATAFIMPSLALSLVGMIGFNIRYDWRLWGLIIMATIIVSLTTLLKRKEHKKQRSLVIILPLLVFVYFFGAITTTNCLFDYRLPQSCYAEVLDKNYSRGSKTSEYTLAIKDWHEETESVKVAVSSSVYNTAEVGQGIRVYISPGLWGIEWYLT